MACHIVAASDGGSSRRKNNARLTDEQLSSASNGIWMCYKHGKLIDGDEVQFSEEMLKAWKSLAEFRAEYEHEFERPVPDAYGELSKTPIPDEELTIRSLGAENRSIGETILKCAVREIWGNEFAERIQVFAIEIVRNMFLHGKASFARIKFSANRIEIEGDGNNYDPLKLIGSGTKTGGARSIIDLAELFTSRLFYDYKYSSGCGSILLMRPLSILDIDNNTKCKIAAGDFDRGLRGFGDANLDECNILYIILPDHACFSDLNIRLRAVQTLQEKHGQLVFVGHGLTDRVGEYAMELFPGSFYQDLPIRVTYDDDH